MLFLYKQKLEEAYFKGYYRTYHRFENNDDRLKGSIDIARHIKLNMGLANGKIAYSYREKTIDNYLNHLIIEAYHYMKKKYPDMVIDNIDNEYDLFGIIKTLEYIIGYPKYDKKTIISKNVNPISHPFYTEYNDLRNVSLQIMRDEGVSIYDGTEEDVYGLLFYIPGLWENYLIDFLKSDNYQLKTQESTKIFGDQADARPDFVFFNNGIPFMILDAKFKPKWGDFINNGSSLSNRTVNFASIEDDYNKCIRDMNAFNSHAAGAIFPTNINIQKESFEYSISEINLFDRFYAYPIFIPSDDNRTYEEWLQVLNNHCSSISNKIKNDINKEKELNGRFSELYNEIIELRR